MRFFCAGFLSLILLIFSTTFTFASNFNTNAHVTYTVSPEGKTKVVYDIEIENSSESALSKGYILSLTNVQPEQLEVKEEDTVVFPEIAANDIGTNIILHFEKPVNGIGKKKNISIAFLADGIAEKSGEIWEVFIPKLAHENDFSVYNATLIIPEEFGDQAYISPNARSFREENGTKIYQFEKADVQQSGISAIFGKYQVFTYNLSYHLQNSSFKWTDTEIALPPDTSIQKIYLHEITPKPDSITIDNDGNWIAHYKMSPFSEKEIAVKGQAQLFASPRKFFSPKPSTLSETTKATRYWQKDDPTIAELGKKLGTPEAIYNYVVQSLTYDYERVRPNIARQGALGALQQPQSAICMEFTDLFIALARAAGIPAREINGFAYSENPRVQPLSLVADVLHSWPEYWDEKQQIWIPVDPTWGHTTKGEDFFNKFDLRHVAFVIHGSNDSKPDPAGSYKSNYEPQKDVYVSLSSLTETAPGKLELSYSKLPFTLFKNRWNIVATNTGTTALYDQGLDIYYDGEFNQTITVSALPPSGSQSFVLESPVGILASKSPEKIEIHNSSTTVSIFVNPTRLALTQVLAVGLPLIGLVLFALLSRRKVK